MVDRWLVVDEPAVDGARRGGDLAVGGVLDPDRARRCAGHHADELEASAGLRAVPAAVDADRITLVPPAGLHRRALLAGPVHEGAVALAVREDLDLADDPAAVAIHEHAEALRLYTRALTILEASLGADHPSAAHVLTGLGETHAAMGHTHEAVALLERALAIRVAGSVQREELAETRFALARALGPEQARRARELALEALHDYAETVGSERERLAVEAWLAAARAAP